MNSALYILLYPLYLLYLGIIFIRNLLYDLNIISANKIDCKVISVGNISFGGTGKTPFTIALAKELKLKYRVAILSRGYKRNSRGTIVVTNGIAKSKDWKIVGDEPFLMSQKLSGVPIVVDEDRTRGGRFLVNKFKPDIILLDDGFQHRKLRRDIDIVLLDASSSSRFNYWREPFSVLNRSDILLLTKAYSKKLLAHWEERIFAIGKPSFILNNQIDKELVGQQGKSLATANIKGKSVIAFSGIANHGSFDNTVQQLECNIVDSLSFEDHQVYDDQDLKIIEDKYNKLNPDFILTTEKDIIKLPLLDLPIYALSLRKDIPKELVENIDNNIRLLD